ncbi:MGH1-like glycoside hydrolase domain-containing protein [Phaeodactylibacter xiamenensis]|uniref:alpha-L-rhamnosidase-related protein n=1 Tax=Phaeodactylibacter xiamenensis TaxID=1524460 RepID=UPI0024A81B9F|nr:alpha-L-rhamnosidase C-terminal domain-containing protein [Phaeodactylibacter xiamenensis]
MKRKSLWFGIWLVMSIPLLAQEVNPELVMSIPLLAQEVNPELVWIRPEGGERNEYVFFRRAFELETEAEQALLHLYADSRYALYVNEQYVGFGPIRSYHAHPVYDTYDISSLLKTGSNVIALKALSNGMETYQLFDYKGGFSAWGQIRTSKQYIDLSITEGWVARKSEGYDQTAPKFSFATGAIENWDSRGEADWYRMETTTEGWDVPVRLSDQSQWGAFSPRPYPPLTQQRISALRLRGAYPLKDDEVIYSFRIPTKDEVHSDYNASQTALGYTYLVSPKAQTVEVGLWWGDYYLNGQKLQQQPTDPARSQYRQTYQLKLKKGVNELAFRYGIIWGSWDFYMAVPKEAAIEVRGEHQADKEARFYTYGPFGTSANDALAQIDMTRSIAAIRKATPKDWLAHAKTTNANQPARDLAWQEFDQSNPLEMEPNENGYYTIPVADQGVTLLFDLNEIQLGRVFVEGDFPEGTQIDIGFSEELGPGETPWLYKRYQIGAGLRFIADGKEDHYASFKPYGMKYLQVNFSGHERPFKLKDIGVFRQVYPFEQIGTFKCSDPLLNRIWEAGWRTLQLCAEDTYTDTPFRERGLYAGDMLPEVAITMAVTGDMRLAEYSLRVFQDMYREEMQQGLENRHNDFPLWTLITLDYVAKYTGDWSLAAETYNNYATLLRHHLNKKNEVGLIPAEKVFLEWSQINKSNAAMTAYQAQLVRSMEILAHWAERFGHPEDVSLFRREGQNLKQAVNEHLWDAKRQAFYDGWKNGAPIPNYYPTSSIWPALLGITDPDRTQKIIRFLKTELMDIGEEHRNRKITPYSSFYLFALLYREGEAELAEYFMKKHWGPMALHSCTPTVWENFSIAGNQGTSSHAWSGHPTYFLATEALGVNLGFNKVLDRDEILIAPQSAHLNWAEGTVAHPAGPVKVRWAIKGDQLWLSYEAPKGVSVKVAPKGRLAGFDLKVNKI